MKDKKLSPGPRKSAHRHPPFSEAYRPFFERMSRLFADLSMGTPEDWEGDFRQDMHPEREMAFWTKLAKHYEHFTVDRGMTVEQKKEVLGVLLMCLSGGPAFVSQPRNLSAEQVKEIVEQVRREAGTELQ